MKTISLILVIIWTFNLASAQTKFSPGGVKGAIVWYQTDSTAVPTFHDLISKTNALLFVKNAPSNVLMNFNPSLVFNGTDSLSIKLPDTSLINATFFAAYQNKSTNTEGVVWHITRQHKTTIIFTTNRLADLETLKYMNYRDFVLSQPKIVTYIQQKPKDATYPIAQYWNIGFKPESPKLPVFSFDSLVPEVIAYDRVLSTDERLKVGSYLAIKYGITLSDANASYLNSRGDIIWNGLAYSNYHHNIAGIARDDSSHLLQLKSASSNAPGLFTISAQQSFVNYSALIWGDNDKPLTKADKIQGMPTLLKKQWLLLTSNNAQPIATNIAVNTKSFDVRLPSQPVYWLVIDRSGAGDFLSSDVEFIKMTSMENNGVAYFSNVLWGLHNNNKEIAAIAIAQDLLVQITPTETGCSDFGGSATVKIIGGTAPFTIKLTDNKGASVYDEIENIVTTVSIKGLNAQKYTCKVTDAGGATYTDSFYINGTERFKPMSVAAAYSLPRSGAISIQADSGMVAGLVYEWSGPDGFHSNNAAITISHSGNYTLKCGDSDCTYQMDITIKGFSTGALTEDNILLYPNPSKGSFTANVSLDEPAPIQMAIYSLNGTNKEKSQSASGRANYQFQSTLTGAGVYLVQFTSGNYVVAKKVIIIN